MTLAAFLWQVVVAIAISVIAYLLTPKPKPPKPEAARQLEVPTAEAGRPIPVLFGTMTIKDPNILNYGDRAVKEYKVKS